VVQARLYPCYMRIEIETHQFEFAHGHRPRGRGYWIFDITTSGGIQRYNAMDAAGRQNMLWSEAKALAQKVAADLKAFRVEVCS
jgi:hypothetical protein